jgi:type VI protein secretion system component Hcp
LRKYFVFAIGLLSVGGGPVTAQFTPTAVLSSATLSIDGCGTASQVTAWTWGESNPITFSSGGAASGRVSISDLTIQKPFDACSALLSGDAATGGHFSTATLTEYDINKNVLMTMVLTTVYVEQYELTGATTAAGPAESVSFVMGQIKITYPNPAGGNIVFCWDNTTLKSC